MSLISPEALRDRLPDPSLRLADVRWWLAWALRSCTRHDACKPAIEQEE